jgi:hypothetical protein
MLPIHKEKPVPFVETRQVEVLLLGFLDRKT